MSWNTETELRSRTTAQKLFWKFLLKSFGSSKIVLTFASAFEKEAIKKSSLKDLDINKQVVQKAYLGKKTETVNNLNKLKIDLVLEQIKTVTAM